MSSNKRPEFETNFQVRIPLLFPLLHHTDTRLTDVML